MKGEKLTDVLVQIIIPAQSNNNYEHKIQSIQNGTINVYEQSIQ